MGRKNRKRREAFSSGWDAGYLVGRELGHGTARREGYLAGVEAGRALAKRILQEEKKGECSGVEELGRTQGPVIEPPTASSGGRDVPGTAPGDMGNITK